MEASFARFLRGRLSRIRLAALLVAQITLATSVSWGVASALVTREVAVFAPIAALTTLAVSMTQRFRRIIALVLGFAVGVLVGDLIVTVSGTGLWQVAVIVAVSMIVAILIGGTTTLIVPAATLGVVIATVTPVNDVVFSRVYDVFIGAGVGILVSGILLPLHPIVIARRAASRMMKELAGALADLAEALRSHADAPVRTAVDRVHAVEEPLREFGEAITTAAETARLLPFRWRAQGRVRPYLGVADRMDHVMRNLRVLTRRTRVILDQEEQVPRAIPDALEGLAGSIRHFLGDLLADREPVRARTEILRAVRVTADVPENMSVSIQVVVARLRSTAVDLLRATGLSYADADVAVRGAVTGPRLRPGRTLLPGRSAAGHGLSPPVLVHWAEPGGRP